MFVVTYYRYKAIHATVVAGLQESFVCGHGKRIEGLFKIDLSQTGLNILFFYSVCFLPVKLSNVSAFENKMPEGRITNNPRRHDPMKRKSVFLFAFASILLLQSTGFSAAAEVAESKPVPGNEKMVIIWTSADKEVAMNMVLMYALNSRKFKWWDDITLVAWGPSQNLLLKDKDVREAVDQVREAGVVVKACRGCAERYGNAEALKKAGIIVEYIDLTRYVKEGRHVLTF